MEWIEVERARIRMRDDGIAEIQHDPHVRYTGPAAEQHMGRIAELLPDGKAPLLVGVPEGFMPDDQARTYLLKSDAVRRHFRAGGLVLRSRPEAIAVNLVLKIARPVCPMKAFHRERDAVAWLTAR